MRILEGKLLHCLEQMIFARMPEEACGLILDDGSVIELENLSDSPENSFRISREEIVSVLFELDRPVSLPDVTLWHSHPNGGVGPSRVDMQQKTLFPQHLVLAVSGETLVPTWY